MIEARVHLLGSRCCERWPGILTGHSLGSRTSNWGVQITTPWQMNRLMAGVVKIQGAVGILGRSPDQMVRWKMEKALWKTSCVSWALNRGLQVKVFLACNTYAKHFLKYCHYHLSHWPPFARGMGEWPTGDQHEWKRIPAGGFGDICSQERYRNRKFSATLGLWHL